MNGFKIKLVFGWPVFSGYYYVSFREGKLHTNHQYLISHPPPPPPPPPHHFTCHILQTFRNATVEDVTFEDLDLDYAEIGGENQQIKTECLKQCGIFLGRDLGREIPGCFRLLFRFSFFRLIVWVFFGNMGVYLSIHFLDDHLFWVTFGEVPLVDWVIGFLFTISKQNTLREISGHGRAWRTISSLHLEAEDIQSQKRLEGKLCIVS